MGRVGGTVVPFILYMVRMNLVNILRWLTNLAALFLKVLVSVIKIHHCLSVAELSAYPSILFFLVTNENGFDSSADSRQ